MQRGIGKLVGIRMGKGAKYHEGCKHAAQTKGKDFFIHRRPS